MSKARVLLVDDHALVRAGMKRLLDALPGVEVVGEAGDGKQAMMEALRCAPEVVLLDMSMPEQGGLETAAWFARELPAVRVIMVTMHGDEASVLAALRAGAAGYLLKRSAPEDLDVALRAVLAGERFLSPGLAREVLDQLLESSASSPGSDNLTPRHREVLQRVLDGRTSREIAAELGISVRTVEAHRAELMSRLGVRNTAELARQAGRRRRDDPDGAE